jgi:hypothetical protein
MTGNSRQRTAKVLMGRSRITEMDLWEQDDIDLMAPGFVEFGEDRRGSLGFIAVQGGIDWRDAPSDGLPGAEFTWEGFDEGDPVNGRGWAAVESARYLAVSTSISATTPASGPSGWSHPALGPGPMVPEVPDSAEDLARRKPVQAARGTTSRQRGAIRHLDPVQLIER